MSVRYNKREIKESDCDSDEELNEKSNHKFQDYSDSNNNDRSQTILSSQQYGNNVNEAYELIEGKNYFAPFYALMFGISAYATGLAAAIPFLVKTPDLECSYDESFTWNSGDSDDACSGSFSGQYKYDSNSIETIDNWITKFDMTGDSDFSIALFGSLYFVGFVIGSISVLTLGDLYGRKPVMVWSTIASIPIYLGLCYANEVYYVYILMVFVGIVTIGKFAMAYLYLLELIPDSKHIRYHIWINLSGVVFAILVIPYFILIDDGLSIFWMYAVFSLLSLAFIYSVPESPRYLYSKKKYSEAHENLAYIARINKAEPWNKRFAIEAENNQAHIENNNKTLGFFEALKDDVYKHNLIIMTINWSAGSLGYYIIGFFLDDFPGSSYINMLIMQIAEFISFGISLIYIKYFGINHGFTVANAFVILFSLIYTISGGQVAVGYVGVFVMRLGVSMGFGLAYFGTSEIFDVKIKSRTFATGNIIARICTISAPLITELISYPIIVVAIVSLLSAVVSQFIKHENHFKDPEGTKVKEN